MATREQCEAKLRTRFKSMSEVKEFAERTDRRCITNQWTDQEFIDNNIRWMLDQAQKRGQLDLLGIQLGIGTDTEQQRIAAEIAATAAADSAEHAKDANKIAREARKWSWLAVAIAAAALIWQIQEGCGIVRPLSAENQPSSTN